MSAIEYSEEDITGAAAIVRHMPQRDAGKLAREVASRHGVSVGEMMGPGRYPHLARARADLYRVLRAAPYCWSYPAIGRFVGGRDHTTVIAAVNGKSR